MKQDGATNWQYGTCPLDTPPAAFGPFADLVTLWQGKRTENVVLPLRRAFDFADFRRWWGRVAIARITHDPFDVRFVLWGTTLTDWWGVDYTNRRLGSAAANPDAWRSTEFRYFEAMAQHPFIGIAGGNLAQHDRSYITVLGLDLPLSQDGETLSHALTAHVEMKQGETMEAFLPDCPITRFATPRTSRRRWWSRR